MSKTDPAELPTVVLTHGVAVGQTAEGTADDEILTWAEVSQVRTKRVLLPKYGKYVVYRTMIPLDEMAAIQARYSGSDETIVLNRMAAILKYVMVQPSIATPEAARALVKADSGVFMAIINDVVNVDPLKDVTNRGNA